VKAVKRFKALLIRKRPDLLEGFFGRASRIVQPPLSMSRSHRHTDSRSVDAHNRLPVETALTSEGLHRDIHIADDLQRLPHEVGIGGVSPRTSSPQPRTTPLVPSRSGTPTAASRLTEHLADTRSSSKQRDTSVHEGRGQAHDPLQDHLFLNIGTGLETPKDDNAQQGPHEQLQPTPCPISESPGAVDINVYEKAYEEEVKKILTARKSATLYLTRRVEDSKRLRNSYENIVDHHIGGEGGANSGLKPKAGFARLVAAAREKHENNAAASADTKNGQQLGEHEPSTTPQQHADNDTSPGAAAAATVATGLKEHAARTAENEGEKKGEAAAA
jgi:calcium/calmodulin-dependent protein kinase kinase 2